MMTWHYRCPHCLRARQIPWNDLTQEVVCPDCGTAHYAPTPGQDHTAYVDGKTWPEEMEEEVIAIRGSSCIAPGCYREHTTLVPRVPLAEGGKISVENLMPACAEHAAVRGNEDFDEWLHRVGKPEPEVVAAGITITAVEPNDIPVQTFGQTTGIQAIASRFSLSGAFPAGSSLLFSAPFVPGPATRLVLYYEWKLGPGESCRVVLGAWPRADQPDFSKDVAGSSRCVSSQHKTAEAHESSALLEIVLSDSRDELWIAAVWVEAEREREVITNYYLTAAVDEPVAEAL
jgi:ribosomal protein S27E